MQTITIPKKLTQRGELVILPRKEYESLLRVQKRTMKMPPLDKNLEKALREVREGKVIGPFTSVSELRKSLSR